MANITLSFGVSFIVSLYRDDVKHYEKISIWFLAVRIFSADLTMISTLLSPIIPPFPKKLYHIQVEKLLNLERVISK